MTRFCSALSQGVAAVRIGFQYRSVGVYSSTKTKADKGHGSDCGLGERKPREIPQHKLSRHDISVSKPHFPRI